MPLELLIVKFIQEYQAYKRNCRKDDDVLIKQRIIDDLTSLRSMVVQFSNEKKSTETTFFKELRSIKNQVDEFIQEVEFSFSGHTYSFFSPQTSVGNLQLKKIMKYDLSLLEGCRNSINRFDEFQHHYNEVSDESILADIRRFNQMLTELRSEFRGRNNLIKKI